MEKTTPRLKLIILISVIIFVLLITLLYIGEKNFQIKPDFLSSCSTFLINQKDSILVGHNLDEFIDTGGFLNITTNKNGDSGKIPLARSNRYPDWYFFDIQGLTKEDKIIIKGSGGVHEQPLLAIGAITFDVFK